MVPGPVLLPAVAVLLGLCHLPGGAQRVKVFFTPAICRMHCHGGRCTNYCEQGNATTLYSGETGRSAEGGHGFRVFLCPLICQNGGVCLKKDKCLCPPNWTGKFCHIPALPRPHGEAPSRRETDAGGGIPAITKSVHTLPIANHQQERDGMASVVNVHVEHPPEASVTIHQVERVNDDPPGDADTFPLVRPALFSVLAQSSPRDPGGYSENSGFGYCFRQLHGGECSAPLPGLRTREICCRGAGLAWGVQDCLPCANGDFGSLARNTGACPRGFQRQNSSCIDVDECQEGSFCHHGECTNTRGSFTCLCREGYILDSSRSSCISHHVISEAKGPCFRVLRDGACSLPILRNITKQICCCSRVGKAWGHSCERCPPFGSAGFKDICPAGPGYHYSASDLRYDSHFLGQDLPRIPVSRLPEGRTPVHRPSPTTAAPATPFWSPPPTALRERLRPWLLPTQFFEPEGPAREAEQGVCERRPQVCGPGRCIPRQGGYTCVCDQGYWLSPQGTHCIDVDECRRRPHPCPHGHCENSVGSYSCRCWAGYEAADRSGTGCQDVDECARSPSPCSSGRCHNTPGSYRCSCPPGYHGDPAGSECRDTDECSQSPAPCARGHCENTPGSYRCICPTGYQSGPTGTECLDVDECRKSPPICQPGRCENVPGGYRCTCPIGYQPNPLENQCVDVDECQQSPRPCDSGRCENVPGRYRCLCPAGFHASVTENQCLDVDECLVGTACGSHGQCLNTEGSFRCLCDRGYQTEGPGRACVDINECLEGDFCFPRGECLNTEGSYTCQCAPGFTAAPHGASCLDIDECQGSTACVGGHCANTEGSFDCYCPSGTRSSPSRSSCEDIDECQEYGAAVCGTLRCENSVGCYRCVSECQQGYRASTAGECTLEHMTITCFPQAPISQQRRSCLLTRRLCSGNDINECQEYGAGLCGERRCQNTPGSYRCSCQTGFQLSTSGDCVDVDECRNGSVCGAHAACHNLPGSFQCTCDQGYGSARDGQHCQDLNECETLLHVCGAATCANVEGSFLCICPGPGEEFDPMTGRCSAHPLDAARPPAFPRRLEASHPESRPSETSDNARRECYYDPNAAQACENVLSWNATRQECCCSLGHGWGIDCQFEECPGVGTAQHRALCPHGQGYTATGTGLSLALADVDECALFSSQVCKGGVCVNKLPGYSCYCPSGYYYEMQHLECIDNDECLDEEAEPCVGGHCINTVGSYYCSCARPLVLDASGHRCVANDSQDLDDNLSVCWREVSPDLVCSHPRLDRQVTYTECCCLYGEAWGMECAFCPARDSEDYETLCNALRPSSYGPEHPGGRRRPFEYGAGEFMPYGPEIFTLPARPAPRLPDYGPYPRDSFYALPLYEATDFEAYGDRQQEGLVEPPRGGYHPPSPPDPEWQRLSPGGRGPNPERPGRASRPDGFGALSAEECGILSGCENGRCVRVADGFTCDCHEGYRLDPTRMACLDINECLEVEGICPSSHCVNTDGFYHCLCPRGSVPAGQPPRCVPLPRSHA